MSRAKLTDEERKARKAARRRAEYKKNRATYAARQRAQREVETGEEREARLAGEVAAVHGQR